MTTDKLKNQIEELTRINNNLMGQIAEAATRNDGNSLINIRSLLSSIERNSIYIDSLKITVKMIEEGK